MVEGGQPDTYYSAKLQEHSHPNYHLSELVQISETKIPDLPIHYTKTTETGKDIKMLFIPKAREGDKYYSLGLKYQETQPKGITGHYIQIFKHALNMSDLSFFHRKPYLVYQNDRSEMTVMWKPDLPHYPTTIEWGTTINYGNTQDVTAPQTSSSLYSYTMENLPENTLIYYKVSITDPLSIVHTYESSFRTPLPADATTLSFYAYGDNRACFTPPGLYFAYVNQAILDDIAKDPQNRQTFIIHVGDYTLWGLKEIFWDLDFFNHAYPSTTKLLSSMPMMGALGNHEGYSWVFYYEVNKTGKLFRKFFPYSYPEKDRFYYSFDYGPVHACAIDTWSYGKSGVGSDKLDGIPDASQVAWLSKDLQDSTKVWEFAFLHTPIYDCRKNNANLRSAVENTLVQEGVSMVFQGHQHYYCRCGAMGIKYLVLGGAGAELGPTTPHHPDMDQFVEKEAEDFHFARIDINDATLTVTVFNVDSQGVLGTIDSFQLTK
jgi:hypothetical protein